MQRLPWIRNRVCHLFYRVDCDIENETEVYVDPEFWEKVVFNLIG